MDSPNWMKKGLPDPGEYGFSSIPGEKDLAQILEGRRRAMSGAGNLPYDVATKRWLIDSKETTAKSFSFRREAVQQLEVRAIQEGRRPMFTVTFWAEKERDRTTWALVRLSDIKDHDVY